MDCMWMVEMSLTPEEHLQHHDFSGNTGLSTESAFDLPHSMIVVPVKDYKTGELVGVVGAILAWGKYLTNILPDGVGGIYCVVEISCGQAFTYEIDGNTVRLSDIVGAS